MDVSPVSSGSYAAALPGLLGQPARAAAGTPAEQRHAAAAQFEAILLRQFLQQSVGSMMGSAQGASGEIYGYLLTDVFAQQIAAGGGLGLSKVIQQQLTPRGEAAAAAEPTPARP
jgi:flagellar protein FlgJ